MASDVYVDRAKQVLRGYGIGEKPVIAQCAATASVAVTNDVVTFDLLAGQGAALGVEAGDVLATYNAASEAAAYGFYVLSVSTDTITAVNGYTGVPIANASTDLDGALLELLGEGSPSEHDIWNAVDLVFKTLLYPHIYLYEQATFTPSVSTQRSEVPATVEEIDDMWQVVGTELVAIPYGLKKNQETSTVSTTGSFVFTDAINGSTVYYNYRRRYVAGDNATDAHLVELVALGAAAILSGWSRPETVLASSRQDSQFRGQAPDVGATLWRDFLALRDQWADDLARTGARRIIVDRG